MFQKMRRNRGFTLLEILVALAILSSTLVVAFRVVSGGIQAESRSERWLHATLLGEAEIRKSLATFPETGDSEGVFPDPDDDYRWKLTVAQALHKDAREVHLIVRWEGDGQEESVTVSGLAVK